MHLDWFWRHKAKLFEIQKQIQNNKRPKICTQIDFDYIEQICLKYKNQYRKTQGPKYAQRLSLSRASPLLMHDLLLLAVSITIQTTSTLPAYACLLLFLVLFGMESKRFGYQTIYSQLQFFIVGLIINYDQILSFKCTIIVLSAFTSQASVTIYPPFLAVCQCVHLFHVLSAKKTLHSLFHVDKSRGGQGFMKIPAPLFFLPSKGGVKKFDKIAPPPDLGGSCHNINFPPAHRPPSLFPMGGDPTTTSYWFVGRTRFEKSLNIFRLAQVLAYVALFAVSGNEIFLTIWRLVQLAQLVIGPDCWSLMLESPKCCRD